MSLYNITKKFNNVKYALGSFDFSKGLDCLTCAVELQKALGKNIKRMFELSIDYNGKKLTLLNYKKYVDPNNIDLLFELLCKAVREHLERTNQLKRGTIVIYEKKKGVGTYLGQQKFAFVSTQGVIIKNMDIDNISMEYYIWKE